MRQPWFSWKKLIEEQLKVWNEMTSVVRIMERDFLSCWITLDFIEEFCCLNYIYETPHLNVVKFWHLVISGTHDLTNWYYETAFFVSSQATRSLFGKHEKQKLLPTPLKFVFHHLMTCLFNIILGFIWLFLPLFLIVSNAIHSVR